MTSARPSPVSVSTPVAGDAGTASCPCLTSRCTTLLPTRPLPPMTTIFMVSFRSLTRSTMAEGAAHPRPSGTRVGSPVGGSGRTRVSPGGDASTRSANVADVAAVVSDGTRGAASDATRHLRPRGEGAAQPITTVELFFDLVYVFAVTQLSHLILDDLSVAGALHATFLLVVVWWAWIYTTWMANWFDPGSAVVRAVLTGVMLASLLMAAALPEALGKHGLLFAGSYVMLQVGRNIASASLPAPGHPLRVVFERVVVWSAASGCCGWPARSSMATSACSCGSPRSRWISWR